MTQTAPYKSSKHSLFAHRPYHQNPNNTVAKMERLTCYCRRKNISKRQFPTLVKHKWVAITKYGGQVYVEELCPEAIAGWMV
jgi:hypothetical protein